MTILVATDERQTRESLLRALSAPQYRTEFAENGQLLIERLDSGRDFSAVVLDLGSDMQDTLRDLRATNADIPVIVVSADSSPGAVVQAMKEGATDYLVAPVSPEQLRSSLNGALRLRPQQPTPLRQQADRRGPATANPAMRELYAMAPRVGASNAPVLFQGETGTGKEVLARYLHSLSPRANKPFFKLNCAALPSELVESELFGYERGAFTGAVQRKPGMFEMADGGTLLLDEIGDMDFKLQAKLLQVLQDHEFQRLGGRATIKVDVRVIAATHKDLEQAIAAGSFRQDLYFRLNVVTMHMPALRERKEDIPMLLSALLQKHGGDSPAPEITPGLSHSLQQHDWPGNVRELENVARKLLVLRDADMIERDLMSRAARRQLTVPATSASMLQAAGSGADAPILEQVTRAKQAAEAEAILSVLRSVRWNRKKAAVLLKIDYKALLYKMKKLGIEDDAADKSALDGWTLAAAASAY